MEKLTSFFVVGVVGIILLCVLIFGRPNRKQNTKDLQETTEDSNTFIYVISFLIPLIGYILGAILLSKEDAADKTVGKKCIVLGVASTVLGALVWGIVVGSML